MREEDSRRWRRETMIEERIERNYIEREIREWKASQRKNILRMIL